MMKNILKLIICCGILILAGCQENNKRIADNLIGKKWNLIKFIHTDTKVEEPVPENLADMNVEFNNAFKIHAVGACNLFDGDYSIPGDDSIRVDNLGRTKMYCGDEINMSWEDNFFHCLKNATSFDISGDRLAIKSNSNIILIFKKN